MSRACLLPAALLLAACTQAPAPSADPPLWFGTWDCDLTQMSFDDRGWSSGPGDTPLPIIARAVQPDGAVRLSFASRPPIVIRVRDAAGNRLDWLSEASGDAMSCTRNAG